MCEGQTTYTTMCLMACCCLVLWPCGLQHARLPHPPLFARVCSNSCPLSWWCRPITLSSVILFSFCLQSFPASGSFLTSQLFASGGQSIGTSASGSVLPMNIQGWFMLGWLVWYHCCPRDFQESSSPPQSTPQPKGIGTISETDKKRKTSFCESYFL